MQGYSCDPKTEAWLGEGDNIFFADCSSPEGNLCKESVCSCNVNFIQRIFEQNWVIPSEYDPAYKQENGFNQTDNCPRNEFPGHEEVQCCGEYPDRFPYAGSASKSCCNQRQLFNPVSHECCEDGSVKVAGEMC